jgi:hypothetical protein
MAAISCRARAAPRITAETWTRRAAAESGPAWPAAGASADGALACDALGCLYGARGRVVALIRDGAALAPDCGAADLVVSPIASVVPGAAGHRPHRRRDARSACGLARCRRHSHRDRGGVAGVTSVGSAPP